MGYWIDRLDLSRRMGVRVGDDVDFGTVDGCSAVEKFARVFMWLTEACEHESGKFSGT